MPSVLIVGAAAGIGRALAAEFASHGCDLVLAGRDLPELQALAADLNLRYGVRVQARCLDILNFEFMESGLTACSGAAPSSLEGVVFTVGDLGDQELAGSNPDEARRILDTNLTGPILALNFLARHFECLAQGFIPASAAPFPATGGSGQVRMDRSTLPEAEAALGRKRFICALGSVAGDRGRQSNYLYGSAKAGLATYLQGLRNRLHRSGVRVITIKPGFVDTRMTYGKPKLFLVARPEAVARKIYQAIEQGRDVVYVPWFWKYLMLIVRAIPERIFKRMRM